MQFIIIATDRENVLEKRIAVRPRHLESLAQLESQIIFAGGRLDETGRPKGSLVVMECPSRAALDAYLAQEPYVVEGVWGEIQIEPVKVAIVKGEMAGV